MHKPVELQGRWQTRVSKQTDTNGTTLTIHSRHTIIHIHHELYKLEREKKKACVCACVRASERASERACVRACVRVCVRARAIEQNWKEKWWAIYAQRSIFTILTGSHAQHQQLGCFMQLYDRMTAQVLAFLYPCVTVIQTKTILQSLSFWFLFRA